MPQPGQWPPNRRYAGQPGIPSQVRTHWAGLVLGGVNALPPMGRIQPRMDPAGPKVEESQAATGSIQGSPRRGRSVRRHLGRI
eukprot:11892503-Heterocapsa_arctica.AAC.1